MHARDVFLCHAGADKETHVYPLSQALARRAVSCWVDEAQIGPGDSIIDAISGGLERARYVLVLITKKFLARRWPQKELNAALSREITTGRVVVLPVLAVDRDTYSRRYPLLADKLYLDWEEGAESVAQQVAALFGREPAVEWHHKHPVKFTGLVWVRVLPRPENVGTPHRLTLRWGPYIKRVRIKFTGPSPISLLHHKTGTDDITLHASVKPASVVTFGQGPPPDPDFINIDEGWTRSAGGHWPGHL